MKAVFFRSVFTALTLKFLFPFSILPIKVWGWIRKEFDFLREKSVSYPSPSSHLEVWCRPTPEFWIQECALGPTALTYEWPIPFARERLVEKVLDSQELDMGSFVLVLAIKKHSWGHWWLEISGTDSQVWSFLKEL